jgi:xyloglucan-specific exo-beta-1,4-glucanase
MLTLTFVAAVVASGHLVSAASQAYSWNNVKIGGGGGFVPGIVFNPSKKVNCSYCWTYIAGLIIIA